MEASKAYEDISNIHTFHTLYTQTRNIFYLLKIDSCNMKKRTESLDLYYYFCYLVEKSLKTVSLICIYAAFFLCSEMPPISAI